MLSCRDVTRKLGSEEAAESSSWLRLQIRLHLLMCRHCRRYARQLRGIAAGVRAWMRLRDADDSSDALAERIVQEARTRGLVDNEPGVDEK